MGVDDLRHLDLSISTVEDVLAVGLRWGFVLVSCHFPHYDEEPKHPIGREGEDHRLVFHVLC